MLMTFAIVCFVDDYIVCTHWNTSNFIHLISYYESSQEMRNLNIHIWYSSFISPSWFSCSFQDTNPNPWSELRFSSTSHNKEWRIYCRISIGFGRMPRWRRSTIWTTLFSHINNFFELVYSTIKGYRNTWISQESGNCNDYKLLIIYWKWMFLRSKEYVCQIVGNLFLFSIWLYFLENWNIARVTVEEVSLIRNWPSWSNQVSGSWFNSVLEWAEPTSWIANESFKKRAQERPWKFWIKLVLVG